MNEYILKPSRTLLNSGLDLNNMINIKVGNME